MEKQVYIFHHTDLDGIGVKILGILYAQQQGLPYKTISCGYSTVNGNVMNMINEAKDVAEVIIGDISVDEETAAKLDKWMRKTGVPVRLRDHHETAHALNKYDWAIVHEHDEHKVDRCGTWMLSQDEDFQEITAKNKILIEAIDAWDTWKWKRANNLHAKNLNALLSIIGEADFTEYCLSLDGKLKEPSDLFDTEKSAMIKAFRLFIKKQLDSYDKCMYTMNLWVLNKVHGKKQIKLRTGVIFCNANLSEIGDGMLDRHPELDLLMMISFPGSISWRTQKQLDIPLGKIAKMATGNGGGHPMAAGSTVSFNQFKDSLIRFMDKNFAAEMDYSDLLSPYEIKKLKESKE